MSDRKRFILTVVGFVAVIVVFVAANFTLSALTSGDRDQDGQVGDGSSVVSEDTVKTSADAIRSTVSDLCATTAPQALAAYATAGASRDELLSRYFTPNAAGLSISVDRIAAQPLEPAAWTGFELTGTERSSASCSVSTGLASPWIMDWTYTAAGGWLCSAVTAPLRGGYVVLGDAPDREATDGQEQDRQ